MEEKVNLQKRNYTIKEKTYVQYRVNIPIDYIMRLGWSESKKLQIKFRKNNEKKFLQIQVVDNII